MTKELCQKCKLKEGTVATVAVDEVLGKLVKVYWCEDCMEESKQKNEDEYPTICGNCNYEMGPIYNEIKGDVNTYLCKSKITGESLADERLCTDCFNKLNGNDPIERTRKY